MLKTLMLMLICMFAVACSEAPPEAPNSQAPEVLVGSEVVPLTAPTCGCPHVSGDLFTSSGCNTVEWAVGTCDYKKKCKYVGKDVSGKPHFLLADCNDKCGCDPSTISGYFLLEDACKERTELETDCEGNCQYESGAVRDCKFSGN